MPLSVEQRQAAGRLIAPLQRPPGEHSWLELDFFRATDENHETAWHRLYAALLAETAAGRVWHPAPARIFRALALSTKQTGDIRFPGSRLFTRINTALEQREIAPINWSGIPNP